MQQAVASGETRRVPVAFALSAIVVMAAWCGWSADLSDDVPDLAPLPNPTPVSVAQTVNRGWRPESAWMPADIVRPPAADCARASRPDGWLRTEVEQSGDPTFSVPFPEEYDTPAVVGYTDRRTAACGDEVAVTLSGPRGVVRIAAYRVGGYRDGVARLVWQSDDVDVQPRPMPPLRPQTHLREARWPVSARIPVTLAWPPGFYLLVPSRQGRPAGLAIPLVVRDDANREPILFVASTLTWNAYNDWGGYSLYHGQGRTVATRYATRARIASFQRPLTGSGYRQLVFMDLPVVRELEQSGVDVAYTTDVDLDQRPSQVLTHAEVVLGGHAEYWTRRGYDALAAARNCGVNLVFLGANNLWWHARLQTRPGGTEPDREIVYRTTSDDPAARRPTDRTLLWYQAPEHRDPAAMLGHSHAAIDVHGGYQLLAAPDWMLAGTGLRAGSAEHPGSVLPLAVGNEADGYNPLAANPPNLTVVAAGVLKGAQGPVTVSASYYVAPSGAGVFAAGTTDWACALQGHCADQRIPSQTATALRQITRNVVLAFAQPRAGLTHPSVPGVTPPPATLETRLDQAAIGTYGDEASEENAVD